MFVSSIKDQRPCRRGMMKTSRTCWFPVVVTKARRLGGARNEPFTAGIAGHAGHWRLCSGRLPGSDPCFRVGPLWLAEAPRWGPRPCKRCWRRREAGAPSFIHQPSGALGAAQEMPVRTNREAIIKQPGSQQDPVLCPHLSDLSDIPVVLPTGHAPRPPMRSRKSGSQRGLKARD